MFDIAMSQKFDWLRFKILVWSTLSFPKPFKDYCNGVNPQFQKFGWWTKKVYHIGRLKYIHPVFANHDDIIVCFKELFGKATYNIDLKFKV